MLSYVQDPHDQLCNILRLAAAWLNPLIWLDRRRALKHNNFLCNLKMSFWLPVSQPVSFFILYLDYLVYKLEAQQSLNKEKVRHWVTWESFPPSQDVHPSMHDAPRSFQFNVKPRVSRVNKTGSLPSCESPKRFANAFIPGTGFKRVDIMQWATVTRLQTSCNVSIICKNIALSHTPSIAAWSPLHSRSWRS